MLGSIGDKLGEILGSLFATMWEWLVSPFMQLKSLKAWVFGKDKSLTSDLVYGTFSTDELTTIWWPGYLTILTVAGSLFVLAVVLHGMRIQTAAVNPSARGALIEFIKDLAIVGICLFNLPAIMGLVFDLNMGLVGIFENDFEAVKLQDKMDPSNDSVLGDILMGLMLLGLSFWANFYYMMRKFTLIILMIFAPLMVVFFLFPKLKGITAGWMKEFVGTVFIQSIHAACYWIMTIFATSTATGIETIILYLIFIPVGESLRGLLGLGGGMHNNMSKAGAMMGMSALAGIAGSVKGALGDQSVSGALKGMYNGVKDKAKGQGSTEVDGNPTIAGNTGTDTGSTSVAEKMLKAGEISSKMGKAVLGSAGSVAGSVMGPVGAIAGASGGALLGSAAGGTIGRVGALAGEGIKDRMRKGKEGWNNAGKDLGFDQEEDIVSKMADDSTTEWASKNREGFMKDMKKRFPDAHQSELEAKWQDKLSAVKDQETSKARQDWENLKEKGSSTDIANKSAEAMTSTWAAQNKEDFMKQYSKDNPPTKQLESLPEDEQKEYQKQRSKAWDDKVGQKQSEFIAAAQSKADNMTKEWASQNKEDFMNQYSNEQRSEKPFEAMTEGEQKQYNVQKGKAWENKVAQKKADFLKAASTNADNMTKSWADENKKDFLKGYDSNNLPSQSLNDMTDSQKTAYNEQRAEAWNNKVAQKKAQFQQAAQSTVQSMTGTKGNSAISKQDFAANFANKVAGIERAEIKEKNPNASKEEIEVEYKNSDTKRKAYVESINEASEKASSFAMPNNKVNTMGVAQYVANNKTAKQKEQFISAQESQGISRNDAISQWKDKEPEVRNQNFSQAMNNLSANVPLKSAVVGTMSKAKLGGITKFAIQSAGAVGGATGVSAATSFATNIGKNVGNTIGQIGAAGALGWSGATEIGASTGIAQLGTRMTGAAIAAGKETGSQFKNQVGQIRTGMTFDKGDVVAKQQSFSNKVGYVGGVIAGDKGYQVGSKLATKINPYNNAVNSKISEPQEVMHLAQKVIGDNGTEQIANGAVRMVTSNNESYIQVRTRTGQLQTVSRMGRGDSGLKQGEVVYQDLNVQDGAFVQNKINGSQTSAYKLDSAGAKIPFNRTINVNPNQILGNRAPKGVQTVKQMQPYNQQVDAGQFNLDDLRKNSMVEEIQLVVNSGSSYVQAKAPDGETYRVSKIMQGDARLGSNEVKQNLSLRNRKLVKEDYFIEDEPYTSSIDPNELIPPQPNKRFMARRDSDRGRFKGVSI